MTNSPPNKHGATGGAAPRPLTWSEKLGYGAGEVGANLGWTFVTGFLLVYYTDVALLPVAALGTLMLVTRTLDAVFDPIVGLIVDRSSSRWGKARPFLLFACIPFAIGLVLTFTVPAASLGTKLLYAYGTFTLLGLLYSLVYVPYNALMPLITAEQKERVQLGSIRAVAGSLGSIVVYGATLPIVTAAGGAEKGGFGTAAAVMAGAMVLLMLATFLSCRERPALDTGQPATSLRVSLARMFGNRAWRRAFGSAVLLFVRISVTVASLIYFAKDVLRQPQLIGILLPLLSVAILVGGALAGPVFQKWGVRTANIASLGMALVLLGVSYAVQGSAQAFTAAFLLCNVWSGFQSTAIFVNIADAAEGQALRFGTRDDGLLVASVSFGVKIGLALGSALTAYVLGWTGYVPGDVSEGVRSAITWLFYGGPALAISLNILLLTGKQSDA
ncbi:MULTISPECIES: glycoside-pentoside-hexuronide (GPH):cation symporter [unclassified Sphingomonas]|uniref:MFS transporter n=1 Tax=unclassified Sphingomonas TaxID=196159 RepID=UPI001F57636C|nr:MULTISPECIES: glycoside-pentoside-hexuronide (GPH):cation symporter [unclassified Sphingomonas]